MVPYYPEYPDRTSLVNYLVAMISTADEYDAIYATSEKKEGIIILTDTTHPFPRMAMIKMMVKKKLQNQLRMILLLLMQ